MQAAPAPDSVPAKDLADDPALLRFMMAGADRRSALFRPTAYWRAYCARIMRELDRAGLKGMRANQRLLKGFAVGGVPQPEIPDAAWKRAAWAALEKLPGIRQIAGCRQHARLALDEIAHAFPAMRIPAGLANGGADDAFDWRGNAVVPYFVMYLSRAADFYSRVRAHEVQSILEIGPGLGLNSLAHIALNPELRIIVNVDIPPVLYLSTQFLKSIEGLKVDDARAMEAPSPIVPQPIDGAVHVYQLAAWQLPRLQGPIDFFLNAFSFQEMEHEVCGSYAAEILRVVRRGVLLHSMISGHKAGAGGQKAPVALDFLESLFKGKFPNISRLDGFWPRLYEGDAASTRLMTASALSVPD
ncbi:MAG TPA: putative sugar O-methyltransferase [Xanthobacteraceae bacterium]|nr:putative sugar O-methyltransferase [Xanthobacteraceae bacterium]